jgi:hypothetical protein
MLNLYTIFTYIAEEEGSGGLCVSHKWESSFAGDRTFFRCAECGETFSISTKEIACPKARIEENVLGE